jgi:myo-inositol-1(or 4)-monophosphatase
LTAVYRASGEASRIAATRLVQSLLGAALAPLTLLLAHRLRLQPRAGIIAAVVVGLYPVLWMYPLGLGSENLFFVLVLGGVLLLLRAADRRPGSALAAGATLAAATLTRGALALFVLFAAAWLLRNAGRRSALLFTLAVAALLAPWAIRNSLVLGRPAFVENSLGYNLFVGYHPDGDGGFVSSVALIPTRFLDDDQRDCWTLQQAVGFIRDDPLRALARWPGRLAYLVGLESRELVYFYSNNFFGPIPTPLLVLAYGILVLPWVAVAGSAPFGMAAADERAGRDLVLLLVIATLLSYLPVLAEPRFHLPLVPLLAPFAAAAWLRPAAFLPPRRGERRLAYGLAMAVLVLLLVLWSAEFTRNAPDLARVMAQGGNRLRPGLLTPRGWGPPHRKSAGGEGHDPSAGTPRSLAERRIQSRLAIMPSTEDRFDLAIDLARRAGELLRAGLGLASVEHKSALELVTQFDGASERLIVGAIRRAFPGDAVLAEEGGATAGEGWRWIIDPLDGTTNFAHGIPHFSVSIAGEEGGRIAFGVVYDPMRDELYSARAGTGAFLNQARLRVSPSPALAESLLVTGFPYDLLDNPENNLDRYASLAMQTRGVRRFGSAALDLAYVSGGRFDGYWELRLAPWDLAAGILLVREAGGTVTRVDGGADVLRPPTSVAASNGLIHGELLEALRK